MANFIFPLHPKIELFSGQRDEFGSNNRTPFTVPSEATEKVISFSVASEGTVKGVKFHKIVE